MSNADTPLLEVTDLVKEFAVRKNPFDKVLAGQEVWAPMALSDGKLVLRDLTKMVCINVRA